MERPTTPDSQDYLANLATKATAEKLRFVSQTDTADAPTTPEMSANPSVEQKIDSENISEEHKLAKRVLYRAFLEMKKREEGNEGKPDTAHDLYKKAIDQAQEAGTITKNDEAIWEQDYRDKLAEEQEAVKKAEEIILQLPSLDNYDQLGKQNVALSLRSELERLARPLQMTWESLLLKTNSGWNLLDKINSILKPKHTISFALPNL